MDSSPRDPVLFPISENMKLHRTRIAKLGWIALVVMALASHGWYRLQPRPSYDIRLISQAEFAIANRGGELMGAGQDTAVLFLDLDCAFALSLLDSLTLLIARRADALTVRVRTLPFSNSDAAVAAACAAEQGYFHQFAAWYGDGRITSGREFAKLAGMPDAERFLACVTLDDIGSALQGDAAAAAELKVSHLPTVVTRRYLIGGNPGIASILELAKSASR